MNLLYIISSTTFSITTLEFILIISVTLLLGYILISYLKRLSREKNILPHTKSNDDHTKLLLESTTEGVFWVNTKGITTYINQAALEMLGFEKEEIIGKSIHEIIHHSYSDGSKYPVKSCPMFKAYDTGESFKVEKEVLWRKDGTSFPVEYASTPIRNKGVIIGSVVLFHDISERIRHQEDLIQRSYNQDLAFQIGRIAYWEMNYENNFLVPNDQFYELLETNSIEQNGYIIHAEKYVKEFVVESFHGAFMTELEENFNRSKSKTRDFKYQLKTAKGNILEVFVRYTLKDSGPNNKVAFGVIQDVTEINKVENELILEKGKLEAILNSSSNAIISVNEQGEIQSFNPSAERIFQYSRNEILGESALTLMYGELHEKYARFLYEVKQNGDGEFVQNQKLEYKGIRKSGEVFPMEVEFNEVKLAGGSIYTAIVEDITKKKEVIKELKEYTTRLEIASKAGRITVWELEINPDDLDHSVIHVENFNRDGNRIPVSTEEFINNVLPEDRDIVRSAMTDTVQHGKEYNINYRINLDGKVSYHHSRGILIRDENDQPVKVIGVYQDITNIKEAEAEIRQNTHRLKVLFDTLPLGIRLVNKQGQVLDSNPVSDRILGVTREEHLQHEITSDFWGVYHLDGTKVKQEEYPSMRVLKEGKVVRNVELVVQRPTKNIVINVSAAPLSDEVGGGTIVVFEDITQRKITERLIKNEQDKFRFSLESMGAYYWIIDMEKHTIEFDSDKLSNQLGYTDFPSGLTEYAELLNHDDRNVASENYKNHIEGKSKLYRAEYRIKNKAGEWVWILNIGRAIEKNRSGEVIKVAGITIDISDQKQLEKELVKAKEEAEKATQAKSSFLARMSHEIRTPMNAIIGLSHLALKTDLSDKQFDYLFKINSSGKSLLGIINDILDFSKVESDQFGLEIIPFDLENLFQELAHVVTYKAHEKDLELVMGIDNDVPLSLIGDPLRLKQILINLVNNAIKFTHVGEVVVHASFLRESENNITLQFDVKDTGIGIPDSKKDKLFQSFSQVDNSTTRKYGGTGLGLTICEKLTHLMGGEIWFDSEPNKGSVFSFTIQVQKDSHQKKDALNASNKLTGLNVLVCDDNETSRTVIRGILESFSYKVTTVCSGAEAIRELEESQEPYDLVCMDWKMPEMDGIETAQLIKSNPKIKKTPTIIMVTAYGKEEIYKKIEELDLSGIVVKPISHSIMFNTIMETFGHQHYQIEYSSKKNKYDEADLKQLKGTHVLLVEDNDVNQQVALELIEYTGCLVDIAHNGKEAVELVAQNPEKYELIFMDIQMPVMDGFEATRLIKEMESAKHIPIIAMTADVVSGNQDKAVKFGMNGFICKPVNPDELYAEMFTHLKGENLDQFQNLEVSIPVDELNLKLNTIDTVDGLKRVNGNAKTYLNLLERFFQNNEKITHDLEQAYYDEDYEKIYRLIHTLKGTSGTIGAKSLHNATQNFENQIIDKIELFETEFPNFQTELLKVLEEIQTVNFDEFQKNDTPLKSQMEVKDQLKELKKLIRDNDFKAKSFFSEMKDGVDVAMNKSEWNQLESALNNFDFESGLQHVSKIIDQSNPN